MKFLSTNPIRSGNTASLQTRYNVYLPRRVINKSYADVLDEMTNVEEDILQDRFFVIKGL